MKVNEIAFPVFTGIRCQMMPYIQGDPKSVPHEYGDYEDIIRTIFIKNGDVGFLTIDESLAKKGTPHRGTFTVANRTSREITSCLHNYWKAEHGNGH